MSKPSKKYHFIQWNMTQHDGDPGVKMLTALEEHVWVRMCFMMQQTEEPGYLIVAGKPIPIDIIAKDTKVAVHQAKAIIKRLAELKIFSRDQRGVIFCRRMVRDEQYRKKAASYGAKGYKKLQTQATDQPARPATPRGIKSHGGSKTVEWNGLEYLPSQLDKILAAKIEEVQRLKKQQKADQAQLDISINRRPKKGRGQLHITNISGVSKATEQISLLDKQIQEIQLKLHGSVPLPTAPIIPQKNLPLTEKPISELPALELRKKFREAGETVEGIINPPDDFKHVYYRDGEIKPEWTDKLDRWKTKLGELQAEIERRKLPLKKEEVPA